MFCSAYWFNYGEKKMLNFQKRWKKILLIHIRRVNFVNRNAVTAANRLVRTFRRRSKLDMLTIWKSIVHSKLDYC